MVVAPWRGCWILGVVFRSERTTALDVRAAETVDY
jgi:hypothetical protein